MHVRPDGRGHQCEVEVIVGDRPGHPALDLRLDQTRGWVRGDEVGSVGPAVERADVGLNA
ncbi:Uncharacterised protein [Mycobacteroides abscessus subsp. abscessus]|nr:Uncharacterised protein [Mycobacteroides abscessus subsp. abscessus]